MNFLTHLAPGRKLEEVRFLKRYKRFLVDVQRRDGSLLTVHNPNTGSMKSCLKEGVRAVISLIPDHSPEKGPRLPGTLELLHGGKGWIGVNTMRTNSIVAAAFKTSISLPLAARDARELLSASALQRLEPLEQASGGMGPLSEPVLDGLSIRPDLYWKGWLIEVKNVTQLEDDWIQFPDAVSKRAAHHMKELGSLCRQGFSCAVVFALSRPEGTFFQPADSIDPDFGAFLREAHDSGLQIIARRFRYSMRGIYDAGTMPVKL